MTPPYILSCILITILYFIAGYGFLGILIEMEWCPLDGRDPFVNSRNNISFHEKAFVVVTWLPFLLSCGVYHIYLRYKGRM